MAFVCAEEYIINGEVVINGGRANELQCTCQRLDVHVPRDPTRDRWIVSWRLLTQQRCSIRLFDNPPHQAVRKDGNGVRVGGEHCCHGGCFEHCACKESASQRLIIAYS